MLHEKRILTYLVQALCLLFLAKHVSAQETVPVQSLYVSKVILSDCGKAWVEKQGSLEMRNGLSDVKHVGGLISGSVEIVVNDNEVRSWRQIRREGWSDKVSFTSIYDMIRAHKGHRVELEVLEGDNTNVYSGRISGFGLSEAIFLLETEHGSQAIRIENVQSVLFLKSIESMGHSYEMVDALRLEFKKPVPKQEVRLKYARSGFCWFPQYELLADEETHRLRMITCIVNKAEPLLHSDVYLVDPAKSGASLSENGYLYGFRDISLDKGDSIWLPVKEFNVQARSILRMRLQPPPGTYWSDNPVHEGLKQESREFLEMQNQSDLNWPQGEILLRRKDGWIREKAQFAGLLAGEKQLMDIGDSGSMLVEFKEVSVHSRPERQSGEKYTEWEIEGVLKIRNTGSAPLEAEVLHPNMEEAVWSGRLPGNARRSVKYSYKVLAVRE